ncbi:MAG: alpha,alpha-trehalase TreF [Bacteroidota bacterium]
MTRRLFTLLVLPALVYISGCSSSSTSEADQNTTLYTSGPYHPWEAFPDLFHDAQMQQVFPDGKTFVDYQPVAPFEDIQAAYQKAKDQPDFDFEGFIRNWFAPPRQFSSEVDIADTTQLSTHLNNMWARLTRQADATPEFPSSLIPLPHPYVVPGGRFREIYYWDSYFTMQGLRVSGEADLIKSMLDNFAYFIDTLGYVPNGNRTYLATRSQPPFFSSMVMLYAEMTSTSQVLDYLPQLAKEYAFWMNGEGQLTEENPEGPRVVRLPDGAVLNRYRGNGEGPRPESYREDVELAHGLPETEQAQLYRNLRAACESGWDFSARWFADVNDFASIRTTRILPVDLNALLYHLETTLALLYAEAGQAEQSTDMTNRSVSRREAMRKYFWSDEQGFFTDWILDGSTRSPYITAAGMYPLYFRVATDMQAEKAVATLHESIRKPGGIVTTQLPEGQQWDHPNGWAPLQWVTVVGMEHYGFTQEAEALAHDWLRINNRVFRDTRKMMEKYNVTDLTLTAGGGEYPTQDGFGWTNGVALGFIDRYGMPPVKDLD